MRALSSVSNSRLRAATAPSHSVSYTHLDVYKRQLLNNYYTNQVATAQVLVEMWQAAGLNVQIEMKENWQQIFDVNSPRACLLYTSRCV